MNYDGEAVHVPEYHVQPDFKGGSKPKTNKKDASHVPQPSLEESISFPIGCLLHSLYGFCLHARLLLAS